MSENGPVFIDEITELRLLNSARENMQIFSQGTRIQDLPDGNKRLIADNIISTYFAIMKRLKTQEESSNNENNLVDYIHNVVKNIEYDFNPYKYRTTDKEEDKARKKDKESVKEHNDLVKGLRTAIKAELTNFHKQGKRSEYSADAEILSAEVLQRENGKEYFVITFADNEKPLDILVASKGNKVGSYYNLQNGSTKNGLSNTLYEKIKKQGKVIMVDKQNSAEVGTKYTASQYKTKSGLKDKEHAELLKNELVILNSLSKSDQEAFLKELAKRKEFLSKKAKMLDKLSEYKKVLAQKGSANTLEALSEYSRIINNLMLLPEELAKEKGEDLDFRNKFVSEYIASDDKFWKKYTEKEDGKREDHGYYDKKLIHVIDSAKNGQKRSCAQICKNLLESNSENIEQDIYDSFKEIQNITTPMLNRKLTAEILTYGVFRAALSNPNEQKFKKMNRVLNEFGLNIKFEQLEVVKLPGEEIKKGSDQYSIDREIFSAKKKFSQHQKREQEFANQAKLAGINKLVDESTHHYHPLKYNAFIEEDVNTEANFVLTARQNLWNVDAHALTHRFDTTGTFIVRAEDGSFYQPDFNGVKTTKAKAGNQRIYILSPVLQTFENGKYRDLLAVADNKGNKGFYISTDNTNEIIKVPPYCNKERKPQREIVVNKKSKDINSK